MDASDRISNAGSGTVGFEHGGRTWRPPKRARGTSPSAPPRDVDVGLTGAGQPPREINPRKLCRTRGLTGFTRGRNAVPVLAWSKFPPPPHMVTVAKKEMPPRPRTPSP